MSFRPSGDQRLLTLGAALLLPVFRGPTRWGDFSYGTYVLHWPIIQVVVALGLYRYHPWAAMSLSILLLAIGATISWFFIEKPSLDACPRPGTAP